MNKKDAYTEFPDAYLDETETYLLHVRDYWNAASNWQNASNREDLFTKFTGIDPNWVSGNDLSYMQVTPEIFRRIMMLLGPHHHAIIKAYLARQEAS